VLSATQLNLPFVTLSDLEIPRDVLSLSREGRRRKSSSWPSGAGAPSPSGHGEPLDHGTIDDVSFAPGSR